MPRYLSINIDTPCDESWDKMDKVCGGRFCHSCEKTVVDLSDKSDAELVDFFLKKKPGVCGRLHSYQLNTPIMIPRKPIPYVKYFFNFLLPAFLLSTKASAQKLVLPKQEQVSKLKKENSVEPAVSSRYKLIQGIVKDFLGKPVPYASVQELRSENGTYCNEQGEFSLQINSNTESLLISSVGFRAKIVATDNDFILTELQQSESVDLKALELRSYRHVAGGFGVRVYYQRIEKTKADHRFLIYPNPAKAGQQSTIKLDSAIKHPQYVCIYNMQGQLISSKLYSLESVMNKSEFRFSVPLLPSGEYAIKLIDEKTGFTRSALMMVQQ